MLMPAVITNFAKKRNYVTTKIHYHQYRLPTPRHGKFAQSPTWAGRLMSWRRLLWIWLSVAATTPLGPLLRLRPPTMALARQSVCAQSILRATHTLQQRPCLGCCPRYCRHTPDWVLL